MKIIFLLLLLEFWVSTADTVPHKTPFTCDFDDEIKGEDHLSSDCKAIKEEDGELFKKALEESKQFKKFDKKLNDFEHTFKDKIMDGKFWDAKLQLYKKTELLKCYKKDGVKFYDCILDKRENMMKTIDKLIADAKETSNHI